MEELINWLKIPENATTAALVAGLISIISGIIGALLKYFIDNKSITYKVKYEYTFDQQKKIKELLSKSKTPLIKASEELNYRLWNLRQNIHLGWHNLNENEWKEEKHYYLRSFVYRILLFWYWLLEAEKSIYSFDFTKADKEDKLSLLSKINRTILKTRFP
jgi:hypothetical protein